MFRPKFKFIFLILFPKLVYLFLELFFRSRSTINIVVLCGRLMRKTF